MFPDDTDFKTKTGICLVTSNLVKGLNDMQFAFGMIH